MDRWKQIAISLVEAESEPAPDFSDKLPVCGEERCRNYDGKRCRLTGFRAVRYCEPVLEAMADEAKSAIELCVNWAPDGSRATKGNGE